DADLVDKAAGTGGVAVQIDHVRLIAVGVGDQRRAAKGIDLEERLEFQPAAGRRGPAGGQAREVAGVGGIHVLDRLDGAAGGQVELRVAQVAVGVFGPEVLAVLVEVEGGGVGVGGVG